MDRESATMPGTSTMGSGYSSSTSGQPGATGIHSTMGTGYPSSVGSQSTTMPGTSTMGSGYDSSTSVLPGATGNNPTMGSGYTSSVGGQSTAMPGTSTMGSGYTSSTSGQPGATGDYPTMGSGHTSSIGGQPGGTTNLSIDQISEFITPSGGQVQVIDEGPAAHGIEGRFGPSHGVDLDGHKFPQDERRSAPTTGSGGASVNTTGSSTTAVNTDGSSGMTGYDDTSRDMSSQDNNSGNRGMTGSENTSSGTTNQGGQTGSGIIGSDVAGRSGGTSNRLTGQDDTLSGPTGGMQQGRNVQGNRPRPEHNTDKTGVTDMHSNDPKFSDVRQSEAGGSSVDNRGHGISNNPIGGFGAAEPSVSADPASGQKPTQKQQGADRPMEEPTGEQAGAVKGEKEMTEKVQAGEDTSSGQQEKKKENKDPNDHSGEPLGTVDHSGGSDGDKKHPGQEGGGAHGEEKENQGTGEEWVKTSGMAADGGDFDATKPGAGREATRESLYPTPHNSPLQLRLHRRDVDQQSRQTDRQLTLLRAQASSNKKVFTMSMAQAQQLKTRANRNRLVWAAWDRSSRGCCINRSDNANIGDGGMQ